jgi:tetratricopeptide (TPR) repeat protein
MKGYPWLLFVVMGFVSACATFQAGSNVQSGRLAFSIGNYQTARGYFESAAQVDPSYVYYSDLPGGSVQSYLGRADYVTERYSQARQELEQALAINKDDNVARLYLGLTFARMGDQVNGLKEIQSAMQALYDWIWYVQEHFRYSYGQFWDINGTIRAAIRVDLAMIASKEINWPTLLADGEWLGKKMDEEIDIARKAAQIWWQSQIGRGE